MSDLEAIEPLPCPNCKVAVEREWPLWKHKTNRQCVWCRKCDMTGPMVVGTEAAIEAWNKLASANERAEKAERERDAIQSLCYTRQNDPEGPWWQLTVTPRWDQEWDHFSEADAILAVRATAGLEQIQ